MTAKLLPFPSRQPEPEEWLGGMDQWSYRDFTHSPLPRGWDAFGEPFTPEREEVELPWWGKLLAWAAGCWLGYVAAAGVTVLASIAW